MIKLVEVLTIISALAIHQEAAAQSMFKCVQDGKTTYQADPCPSAARQDTLKAPPSAPADEPSPEPAPMDRLAKPIPWEIRRTIDLMSSHKVCAEAIQGWADKMAEPYASWAMANQARITRIENDRTFLALYNDQLELKRKGRTDICRDMGRDLRSNK
jgi:hypothetical protein